MNPGPSACKADVIPLHHVPGTAFRIGGFHVASVGVLPAVQHKRHRGDSNPCGQSPMDFESISLTARTQCHDNSRGGCTPNGAKRTPRTPSEQEYCAATKLVPRGLEPRTLRLLAVRSNQLSYETRYVCHCGLLGAFCVLVCGALGFLECHRRRGSVRSLHVMMVP